MITSPCRRGRRILAACILLLSLGAASVPAHGPITDQIERIGAGIAADPGNASLYFKRGELHRIHGDGALALADYNRSLDMAPPWRAAELGRARVFLTRNQPDAALAAADRFLSNTPSNPDALVIRSEALAALGRIDDAIGAMDRAIAVHPEPSLYLERAKLIGSVNGRHDRTALNEAIERAIEGLDAGVKKLGPVVALQFYAIELEVTRGRYDAALTRLDAIAPQYGRIEQLLVRRGEILDTAGRHMEAQAAYTDAFSAITSLPTHTRTTPASQELEARVREKLAIPHTAKERP